MGSEKLFLEGVPKTLGTNVSLACSSSVCGAALDPHELQCLRSLQDACLELKMIFMKVAPVSGRSDSSALYPQAR